MIIIIYLSYVFSKHISSGAAKINRAKHIKIVDRVMVGQDRYVMIIQVQSKFYLTGVTPQSIQILSELEGFDTEADTQVEPMHKNAYDSFKTMFNSRPMHKDK